MQISTIRFGTIEVKDDSIIKMTEGMLGFEQCERYVLLEDRPGTVFKWMQAVDDPTVAFMVINPNDFFPDYEVELNNDEAESLGLTNPSDSVMLTTVTLSRNEGTVTTNLLGPIIINLQTLQGRQVLVQDDRYCVKHIIGNSTKATSVCELSKAA